MAVVNGNVNIKIQIDGTGDGVAKTKAAEKAVESLKKEVGAAGAAGVTSARQLGGIRDSIKPLDGARSTFENIRSNLLGFPLAIGAAVGGIIDLASKIADVGSASERLRERANEYAAAIAGAKKDLEELLKINGRFASQTGGPIGADAGDRYAEINDKISTLQAREREILDLREQGLGILLESKVVQTELTKTQHEIAELGALQVRLQSETANAVERQLAALKKIVGLGLLGLGQGGGAGKVIDLDKIGGPLIIDRPRGGGGGRTPRRETAADIIADLSRGADANARDFASEQAREADRAFRERLAGYDAANDNDIIGRQGKGGKSAESGLRGIANDIRDVSAALSEALPGMGEFSGALQQIAEIWGKWGGAAGDTKDAVVGSLGAIAKAGAAQIKDERLRAGVLSIIELGLGFANLANPPIAAGHFTAAAVLGSVAIFGGGSGSGRGSSAGGGSSSSQQRPVRVGSETLGQGSVQVVIHGNYYGGRSEQEAGADFSRLTRRTQGTGFERGRDAA